jgi:hypothetical protein
MGSNVFTVMLPLTEEQEKILDRDERIEIDNKTITKDNIYCYGEIDVDNPEDISYIRKFNIINLDASNSIYSNYDYDTGEVILEGNVAKVHDCYDVVKWFKYNYLLIGKPSRILIYKGKKEEL